MRLVGGVAVGVLVLAVGALVLERLAIARWAAESWLRQRGVEGLVDITSLDLGRFTGSLRLGDPNNPALKVERVEVDYALTGPWNGQGLGVRTRAVRLEKPRLAARFKDGRLTFGVLQPIIEEALRHSPTGPSPSVRIHQGLVTILTDAGPVVFAGDALVADRALRTLDGQITALALRSGQTSLVSSGGPVWARTTNGVLKAQATLDLTTFAAPGLSLRGGALSLAALTAYPSPKDGRLEGTGDFTITVARANAAGGGLSGEAVNARATLPGLQYAAGPDGISLTGGGVLALKADRLVGGNVSGRSASAVLRLSGLTAVANKAGLNLAADTSGAFNAAHLMAADLPLAGVALSGEGPFRYGPNGPALTLVGGGGARLAMSRAEAVRVTAATPALAADPAYRKALAGALADAQVTARRVRLDLGPAGMRVTLGEPARVEARSGARLVFAPVGGRPVLLARGGGAAGAARITLAGGGLPDIAADVSEWSAHGRRFNASLSLNTALDYGPARGIKTSGRIRAVAAPGDFRLVLLDCAPLSIARLEGGEKDTTGLEARVCPAAQPLVVAKQGGWVAHGGFQDASALSELLSVRVRSAAGAFEARGARGQAPAASAQIASATVVDTQGPVRFEPVRASGQAALAREVWTGRLDLAAPSGPALGEVRFVHDLKAGAGSADVEAPALTFAKDGFQPIMISPLAEVVAGAEGSAAFRGRFDWTRDGLTSSGRISTADFAFSSPVGEVHGLSADIALASLTPLATPPGQSVRIARIDTVTPLTDVTATFELAPDILRLAAAEGVLAKGRVSLEPMVVPLGRDSSVKGAAVLKAVDLGAMIADSSLADSISLDAVVDGRLPFEAGPQGWRFVEGRLEAIRPGRISISRAALSSVQTSAPATPPGEINAVQEFAYQAMENLSFQSLSAEVASRAGGRLGVLFRIQGKHDPAKPEVARISIRDLLSGQALKKRIPLPAGTPINLILDTSLNFDELLQAFRDIWAAKKSDQHRSAAVQGR